MSAAARSVSIVVGPVAMGFAIAAGKVLGPYRSGQEPNGLAGAYLPPMRQPASICRQSRRAPAALALLLGAVLALTGCRRGPTPIRAGDLSIVPGYVNAAPGGDGGVAYFVTHNGGAAPDTLRSVAVAGASAAHLHTVAQAGGPERMTLFEQPTVPPGGALVLRPGEAHLMFEGFSPALRLGDTVRIQLRFARNGPVEVPLVVRPYGG